MDGRKLLLFFLVFLSMVAVLQPAEAAKANHVTVYLFWGQGCPHCAREKAFLSGLQEKYPDMEVRAYDVWYNAENKGLYRQFAEGYQTQYTGKVPATFISDRAFLGFDETEAPELFFDDYNMFNGYAWQIEETINRCSYEKCPQAEDIFSGQAKPFRPLGISHPTIIELPFIGRIDASAMPLPLLSAVLGLIDGFNACAMFVLLVLLGLLVRTKSRRKLTAIAGIFLFVSGAIYFLFMTVWLNFFQAIEQIAFVYPLVGAIAIIVGIIDIKDFFALKNGPSRSISDSAKPGIFAKMRKLIEAESFLLLLIAAIILAVSVNFVEFLCTFGIPMVYTKILAEQSIPILLKYLYMGIYIFFYMLDDTIMVAIAVLTLSSKKMTEDYGRALKLVTGLIMVALGLLLVFAPQLLVFG